MFGARDFMAHVIGQRRLYAIAAMRCWRIAARNGTEYSLLSDHTKVPQDFVAGPDLVT